jgi:hypothetical protein
VTPTLSTWCSKPAELRSLKAQIYKEFQISDFGFQIVPGKG